MSQELGNYYDSSVDITELRRINAETQQRIKEVRESFFNINTEETFPVELILVNKIRTQASGTVSIIKNYNNL